MSHIFAKLNKPYNLNRYFMPVEHRKSKGPWVEYLPGRFAEITAEITNLTNNKIYKVGLSLPVSKDELHVYIPSEDILEEIIEYKMPYLADEEQITHKQDNGIAWSMDDFNGNKYSMRFYNPKAPKETIHTFDILHTEMSLAEEMGEKPINITLPIYPHPEYPNPFLGEVK